MSDTDCFSTSAVELRWGLKIPMRDGLTLHATLYLPRKPRADAPCAISMTPYTADTLHDVGITFATHGFPFAAIDVRGRGNSEGSFRPMIQEARDGFDTVEWIAQQPFSHGKVVMCGGSYLGYAQWATAKEFPPHLLALAPAAAPFMGVDFPMRRNIFYPFVIQWLNVVAGRALQTKIFSDTLLWSNLYRQWHESGCSLLDFNTALGSPAAAFSEWLSHPCSDEYWDAYNPSDAHYAKIDLPILTITGIYDDDQPGALEHYQRHMRHASAEARNKHFLVIGPWDHQGTRTPAREFGGTRFGDASLIDLRKLQLDWYAWTLLDAPRPAFLKKRVAYYITGLEEWRYADSVEEVTAQHSEYLLDSSRNADDIFCSGSLSKHPGQGSPDYYRYDPSDTTGPEVNAEARVHGGSLVDQSVMLALRGKLLVYQTEPLTQDTLIAGFFKLSAWIAIDCPDSDLFVSVYDVAADGTLLRLSTDAIRARYRLNPRKAQLIHTLEPLLYEFDQFTFCSRLVRRGHRLRLVLAPMGRLVESTFQEKNYNAGGVVAQECVKDARAVTVKLFHDHHYRSVLQVPIGR